MLNSKFIQNLRRLPSTVLRAIKVEYSTAKGNTHGYHIFRAVDRILTDREGITHFKHARAGDCVFTGF